MKTVKNGIAVTTIALAAALLSFPARAAAATSPEVGVSARHVDPTWPRYSPRSPAFVLRGAWQEDSFLRRDPTWPAGTPAAPAIPLQARVAERPASSIDNDGPSLPLRTFAPLRGEGPF